MHVCCAPCFSHPHEILNHEYDITVFYTNSNIHPHHEYERRFSELNRFAGIVNIPLIGDDYNPREWFSFTKAYRFMGERSERCRACFKYRLGRTFSFAKKNNYQLVGTVLSVSPHKDSLMINSVGRELSGEYNIPFMESDFKKRNGFAHSMELSRRYGFYRQDYCGCIWSRVERKKDSVWNNGSGK